MKPRYLFALRLQGMLATHFAVFLKRELLLHLFLVALRIACYFLTFTATQLHQHFLYDTHNLCKKIIKKYLLTHYSIHFPLSR